MFNKNGVLGYITPSSYFNSIAGAYMRKYFAQENLLKAVVDLKHFQAFTATTYTAITILLYTEKDMTKFIKRAGPRVLLFVLLTQCFFQLFFDCHRNFVCQINRYGITNHFILCHLWT